MVNKAYLNIMYKQEAENWGSAYETHADKLAALANDYQRYQYARIQFQEFQAEWWRGQAEAVQDVLLSDNTAYDGMTVEQRIIAGKQRWAKSGAASDLAGLEQMWHRWMLGYAQTYEMDRAREARQRESQARPR